MSAEAVLQDRTDRKSFDPIALQSSFYSRGLFIPRSHSRRAVTTSRAAAFRSNIPYVEPPSSAALSARGYLPVSADVVDLEQAPGVFEELGMLGVTVAAFRDQSDEDRARKALQEEYEFVPDFRLRLPDRQKRARNRLAGQEAQKRLEAKWPEDTGIARAHREGIDGHGVLVGALDTGVDAGHEEFSGTPISFRYVSFYPRNENFPSRDVYGFDTDSHGTHVAGILAGSRRGIAPGAKLYMASVIESETTGTSLTRVIEGLNWLLSKFVEGENQHLPAVINMSLGMPEVAPRDISRADYETRIRAMRYIVQDLLEANVLTVAAIGNSGEDTCGYPGTFGETLGVGAVDFEHQVAAFSGNRRPITGPIEADKPDLVGYGVNVFSCTERDMEGRSYYDGMDGTSMASPYVAGIAALYRCAMPARQAADIRETVLKNCLPLPKQPAHRVGMGLARFNGIGIV